MHANADAIREFVIQKYILTARRQAMSSVWLSAREIHANLGLVNRMPAVCGALDAEKFLSLAQVTLITREGPHFGATARWHFSLR